LLKGIPKKRYLQALAKIRIRATLVVVVEVVREGKVNDVTEEPEHD
jgi:hypothetical protein